MRINAELKTVILSFTSVSFCENPDKSAFQQYHTYLIQLYLNYVFI